MTKYIDLNGTSYTKDTPLKIMSILEEIRIDKTRVRFHWGDTKTGLDWEEVYDVSGTISRSGGMFKIPILIHNKSSSGGCAILTDCIVRITHANKKNGGVIYEHPSYHTNK